jgi:hypothetical protein
VVAMTFELSKQEATFLHAQLARHVVRVEDELVHTDKHELQRLLARDLEELVALSNRLARFIASGSSSAELDDVDRVSR